MLRVCVPGVVVLLATGAVLGGPEDVSRPLFPFTTELPLAAAPAIDLTSPPVISGTGVLAFVAVPAGADAARSPWLFAGAQPAGVLGPSLVPAALGGASITEFGELVAGPGGHVAVLARLAGPGVTPTTNLALLRLHGAAIEVAARTGDPAPGAPPGAAFSAFQGPRLDAQGNLAFFATLAGPGIDNANFAGIWAGPPGALRLVARTGVPFPFTPPDARLTTLGPPVLGAAGDVTFLGTMAGGGIPLRENAAIFAGRPDSPTIIVRKGALPPGSEPGTRFFAFNQATTLAAGDVAFQAIMAGTPITPLNDSGIWAGPPGSLALLARTSFPAPGAAPAVFASLGIPRFAPGGQIAFGATLSGFGVTAANDSGVWAGRAVPGGLRLVAREGQPVPGGEAGLVFATFSSLALGAGGHVLFMADLAGPGMPPSSSRALCLFDPTPGAVVILARTGERRDVGGGEHRHIAAILAAVDGGGDDGRPRGLTDRGGVVYGVTFTEGGAAVYAAGDLTPIPPTPVPCSPADVVSIGGFPPADGELTVDDYTSFINAFAGDEALADIVSIGGFPPPDGELTVDDYTSFINAFAEGCAG